MRNLPSANDPRPHGLLASKRFLVTTLVALLASLPVSSAMAQGNAFEAECGPNRVPAQVPVGPFDYRTERRMLEVVETFHFPPASENLIKPTQGSFGGNFSYALIAFPNHHRALAALIRLSDREKTDKPRGSTFTTDCFFRRALRFAPDDTVARMLYVQYLISRQRRDDAVLHLNAVEEYAQDSPETLQNLGLLRMELGDFEAALKEAHKVMALGFNPRLLREQLVQKGRWRDPDTPTAADGKATDQTKAQ
jgi:tetratricopeptide (TPR) repeat protein